LFSSVLNLNKLVQKALQNGCLQGFFALKCKKMLIAQKNALNNYFSRHVSKKINKKSATLFVTLSIPLRQ
jgi:hypothetical protein